ncbi:Uncharacterised protein g1536 [Pycnogonum litorale]
MRNFIQIASIYFVDKIRIRSSQVMFVVGIFATVLILIQCGNIHCLFFNEARIVSDILFFTRFSVPLKATGRNNQGTIYQDFEITKVLRIFAHKHSNLRKALL